MPYVIKRGGLTYRYVSRGSDSELYHHGILGQKWGVRNGPPYPLKAGDHSRAEKKAGYTKSISGGAEQQEGKRQRAVRSTPKPNRDLSDTSYYLDSKIKDIHATSFNVKEKPATIVADAAAVNPNYNPNALTQRYSMNCTNCIMAYALRRMGLDVEARPLASGRDIAEMELFFDDCMHPSHSKETHFNPKTDTAQSVKDTLIQNCKDLCGDDAGVGFIRVQGAYCGHVFNWEKLDNGDVIFIDAQSNDVDNKTTEKYFEWIAKGQVLAPGAFVSRLDDCRVDTKVLNNAVRNSKEKK